MTIIRHAGLTDQGRVRGENQDRWFAEPEQGLYMVADGMGGTFGGGLAAQVVVETLPRLLRKRMRDVGRLDQPKAKDLLLQALAELSDRLRDEARHEFGLGGLGSTVVLLSIRDQHAIVAHMGDSRAYLLRQAKLEQLTRDHTIVQVLLDCEEITSAETADHPARGQLTRFVGMNGEALPEARLMELALGDRLLLCSDGLTGMLSDERIRLALVEESSLENACHRLVAEANEAGGNDNISAVIVTVSRRLAGSHE